MPPSTRVRTVEVAPERLDAWLSRFEANNPDGPQRVLDIQRFEHDALGLILIRRGGYAIGFADGPDLVDHKVGSRYVQSRTAAGGWSQQRYARRRSNQADELVSRVQDLAAARLVSRSLDALVVGGDAALVAAVLQDPRLAALSALPRRELFDLPDPKLDVLRAGLTRARAVRISIEEPG